MNPPFTEQVKLYRRYQAGEFRSLSSMYIHDEIQDVTAFVEKARSEADKIGYVLLADLDINAFTYIKDLGRSLRYKDLDHEYADLIAQIHKDDAATLIGNVNDYIRASCDLFG